MRLPLMLCLIAVLPLSAAETVARWGAGPGTIGDQVATPDASIPSGLPITAGDRTATLLLAGGAEGLITIAPKATVVLSTVHEGDATDLALAVHGGAVEVDLDARGPWRELRVTGGAMEVHVVGTLFMFERVNRDQDYLAMVRGKVQVNLIGALAQALGQNPRVELGGQTAIGASTSGFTNVESVSVRPTLAASGKVTTTSAASVNVPSTAATTGTAATAAPVSADTIVNANIERMVTAVSTATERATVEKAAQTTVQQVSSNIGAVVAPPPLPTPPAHP